MPIEGVDRLIVELKLRKNELTANAVILVGYTAKYGIYVHENLEMKLAGQPRPSGLGTYWNPGGNKFLERPFRQLKDQIIAIVADAYKRGATLKQALLRGGLFLQRNSQEEVPVEYGFLRASAFTREE